MNDLLTIDRRTLSAILFRAQRGRHLRYSMTTCGAEDVGSILHSVDLLAAKDPEDGRYVVVGSPETPVGISFEAETWDEILPRAVEIVNDVADLMAMTEGGILLVVNEVASIDDLGLYSDP